MNFNFLLSIREKMAVGFGKFSFFNFLCNVGFLKNLVLGFYDCCSLKLHFGQIFKILTFDFPREICEISKIPMIFQKAYISTSTNRKIPKLGGNES
jgi:hypothetical protein